MVKLNYEEFKEYVKDNILKKLPDTYSEFDVSIEKNLKNNGLELDTLFIKSKDKNKNTAIPNIYLNGIYEDYYGNDVSLDSITEDIAEFYLERIKEFNEKNSFFDETLSDYKKIKKYIVGRILNTKNNEKLLSTMPHTNYMDLSVVYYAGLPDPNKEGGIYFVRITNEMANSYGVTAEELDQVAKDNVTEDTVVFENLIDMIKGVTPEELFGETTENKDDDTLNCDNVLYILTNQYKAFGAVLMTNPKVLEMVSKKIGEKFFILPSSIHETLILANNKYEIDELRKMVTDVNQKEVAPEERLSDNVYLYKSGKLSIA